MSLTLDAILSDAADGSPITVELSPESSAVLLYAVYLLEKRANWLDLAENPLDEVTREDWDAIEKIVANASYEIMTEVQMIPVGATMFWHTVTPPTGWLICNGGLELKTQWPELFALWGSKYGGDATHFALPNVTDFSIMGAGGALVALDATAGAATHTLNAAQIPAHNHPITDPGHVHPPLSPNTGFVMNKPASANTTPAGTAITGGVTSTGSATTGITVNNNTGGGGAHNNLSPVFGAFLIVYAGRMA